MNPSRKARTARRRPLFRIEAERLEDRQLLTGGAGNTLALARGTIVAAGGHATVAFAVESSSFTVPRGRMTLGIDVVANGSSTLQPQITNVGTPAKVQKSAAKVTARPGDQPHAVLATIKAPKKKGGFSAKYVVKVAAVAQSKGDFLLGYYLPGDADGDGRVSRKDIKTIRSNLGQTVSGEAYSFDSDTNRDGAITPIDIALARGNLGVRTTISPDITANLDPSTDTGAADRITNHATVKFTGAASPGAAITYQEVNGKSGAGSAIADASGKYVVTLPLAEGTSTYRVRSVDSFGQTIEGTIQPVTYTKGTVPAKIS